MILDRPDIKPIWSNCKDSLRHAAYHFSKWKETDSDKRKPWYNEDKTHHGKWAIVSLGHAADCYLRIIAKEHDPECPLFVSKSKTKFFKNPCIPETIKYLQKHYKKQLHGLWKKLFELLGYVHEQRNQITHHIIPEEITISLTVGAWAFLGLLRSIRERYSINSDTMIDQSPAIEMDLYALIKKNRLHPYARYIETSLAESCDMTELGVCPICETLSVLNGYCEVCFQGISTIECCHCGEQCFVPDDSNLFHHLELNICPSCGNGLCLK